ncbi:hypothetical protein Bbelb_437930 [Branchiostoma belcheri]|nr:hypothetical protein Bbelb_437930 [Branchiostoma belcheri]
MTSDGLIALAHGDGLSPTGVYQRINHHNVPGVRIGTINSIKHQHIKVWNDLRSGRTSLSWCAMHTNNILKTCNSETFCHVWKDLKDDDDITESISWASQITWRRAAAANRISCSETENIENPMPRVRGPPSLSGDLSETAPRKGFIYTGARGHATSP